MQGNFCGIFATHQHALFQDQLGLFPSTACEQPLLQRTTQLRTITESTTPMLDVLDAPRVCREVLQRACFKVLHGVNTNSLAFQVANLQVSLLFCSGRMFDVTIVEVASKCMLTMLVMLARSEVISGFISEGRSLRLASR